MLAPGLVLDPHRVIELSARADDAAGGALAERLTDAFEAARAAADELGEGACIVFMLDGDESLCGGASALVRSLALEWAARRIRVNAVCGERSRELVEFIVSPAARMLTGAVLPA